MLLYCQELQKKREEEVESLRSKLDELSSTIEKGESDVKKINATIQQVRPCVNLYPDEIAMCYTLHFHGIDLR